MDGLVSAYSKATGKKQRIPAHWIGHPVFGRKFELTPSAKAAIAAEAEVEAGGAPSESWKRKELDDHAAALGLDTTAMANKAEVVAAIEGFVPEPTDSDVVEVDDDEVTDDEVTDDPEDTDPQEPGDNPSPDESPATGNEGGVTP